jgi:hypothetical protein
MIGNVTINLDRQFKKEHDYKRRNWKIGSENLGYMKFRISRALTEMTESCSTDLK